MWPAFPTPDYYDPLRLPARPPTPLPGFAGYRRGIASRQPADRRGRDGSPGFPGRPSARSTPNTPEGSSAPAPGPRALSVAFAVEEPARHPLSRLAAELSNDACSGFTCVADRAIAPAPLRTRPLGHARGLHYRGPRRLPGPDSHRQAALNLSLLRHVVLLHLMAPDQSRRTRPSQHARRRVVGGPPSAALRGSEPPASLSRACLPVARCSTDPAEVCRRLPPSAYLFYRAAWRAWSVLVQDRAGPETPLFRSLMRASAQPHRGGQFIGRLSMTGRRCCHHPGRRGRFLTSTLLAGRGPSRAARGRRARALTASELDISSENVGASPFRLPGLCRPSVPDGIDSRRGCGYPVVVADEQPQLKNPWFGSYAAVEIFELAS